ncbi:dihydroorotase [Candidatus Liberibacter solanacearum CLso-ZC1]|uniref:Dihydroorotase n=1 Tax=Liberibacter solanacearum (strain CLso-ZC1) TaxID=658172 RepID=E4UD35_LIBSC|nr:amidohydrolase family protein [Candidatus Liberibacter solanacearum]ADR52275.1 dihydroorotase [Candidatus Liberibacter solanacearum CLso-ZC1]
MTSFVLNNIRIIDPSRDIDEIGAIIVENGIIIASGSDVLNQELPTSAQVRNCKGLVAVPGLIDARVTLEGSPEKYANNIVKTSKEAAAGGITSIILTPFSVSTAMDEYTFIKYAFKKIQENSLVNVYPTACLTCKMEGKKINEMRLLQEQGAVSFVHNSRSIYDTQVLLDSMKYAHMLNAIVSLDTHDYFLGSKGTMNESMLADCLGLEGIPAISETIPLARDLLVAQHTGGHYHASAISTPQSISILNYAKENKIKATCGISINNLALNENDVGMYNSFRKVLPPLRSEEERVGMVESLASGNIDIIVSDHTPHHIDTKLLPFAEATFGSIGLETMLSAALRLFHGQQISLKKLIQSMSTRPAQIFNIPGGTLRAGVAADIALIDLNHQWIVKSDDMLSSYRNTVFDKEYFTGRVVETYVSGECIYKLES